MKVFIGKSIFKEPITTVGDQRDYNSDQRYSFAANHINSSINRANGLKHYFKNKL